jgi:predicted RNA-binding protein (TIGR00451 family)
MTNEFNDLQKIRSVGDYQFGKGFGQRLFPRSVKITYAGRTGRIRHVFLDQDRLVTLRPNDGLFSLTINGARRLIETEGSLRLCVIVKEEAVPFIVNGRSVFAKHVLEADEEIRPQEEVIIIDCKSRVLAVGRATLSGKEMKAFMKGVAVRVRRGLEEQIRKEI